MISPQLIPFASRDSDCASSRRSLGIRHGAAAVATVMQLPKQQGSHTEAATEDLGQLRTGQVTDLGGNLLERHVARQINAGLIEPQGLDEACRSHADAASE